MLGRILGDTVREQEGEAVFDIVERIRQTSIRFHRDNDENKLTVLDEVANGLSYYDYTFLREVPRLFSALQDDLQAADPADRAVELASFLRIGSLIGGDRDGNPFVTPEVLGETLRMQSTRACRFYLDELHELGAELSLSNTIVGMSQSCENLPCFLLIDRPIAERSLIDWRSLASMTYRRDGARAQSLRGGKTSRRRGASLSKRGRISARAASSRPVAVEEWITRARGRLRSLRRAIDCFGFHLASVDLRQNSDVHERTIAESVEAVAPGGRATLSFRRRWRASPSAHELTTARALVSPFAIYSEETNAELMVFRMAAQIHAVYGRVRPLPAASFPRRRRSPTFSR